LVSSASKYFSFLRNSASLAQGIFASSVCDEKQFDSPYRGRDKVAYQPRMKAMPYNGKTKPATIDPDTPTMILARGPNPATQKRQYSPSSHRQHQQRAK